MEHSGLKVSSLYIAQIKQKCGIIERENKVDMTDFPNDTNRHFETRALAAFALIMTSGLEVTQASAQVTDGYHDMGIDAIYLDETQKKLFLVQGKWRADGVGSTTQDEMSNFAQGVQRDADEGQFQTSI